MNTRPILFSAPMIQAILDGRKGMTRRVIKPQPIPGASDFKLCWIRDGFPKNLLNRYGLFYKAPKELWIDADKPFHEFIPCPYGQPGDFLYVKETWYRKFGGDEIVYRADGEQGIHKWASPLFMPRTASRLTLETTAIRAERLLDISLAEARLEGFDSRVEFLAYWDSLNEKRGFPSRLNPRVWALSFKRVEAPR